MFVYADNAATTSVSRTALDAMLPWLTEKYGNPSSLYGFGQEAREAVEKARASADKGWNVLLSPACASFDMFKDYEERGRVFKEIVNNLKSEQ